MPVSRKKVKPLLRRNQKGPLPKCVENNQDVALYFAGPFQNAAGTEKCLLVSIDHYNGWPEANFLGKPFTEKVNAFLKELIARHAIWQIIRTDPATVFRSKEFEKFRQNDF